MRFPLRGAAAAALAVALASCTDGGPLSPLSTGPSLSIAATSGVFISEFHYDNAGIDTGERIEIGGPAGTSLAGWSIVLYNGSGGAVYRTTALSGTIPAVCGANGVIVVTYPTDGIQNGSPDGIALVDNNGQVVELLSYEGGFTAVGGPAKGQFLPDIGVSEPSTSPATHSLQRNASGGWNPPAASTFGACNGGPPPPPGPTTLLINELMQEPLAALSPSWGEWFEVYNYGTEPVDLSGWKIRSGGDTEHTIGRSVIVAPGAYAVLGRADNFANNGHVTVHYNYFTGNATTIWLDASDWLVLRSPAGATVDSVRWTSVAPGAARGLRDPALDNVNVDGPNWGFATQPYGSGDFGTPGAANGTLSNDAPPVPTGVVRITFTGRDGSDPPLPVGFQDQLFARAFDAAGAEVATTFSWSSLTPALASVDQVGVVTALGAGVALIRAVSADGRVGTYPVPTRVAVASATADYQGNAEFGEPSDGSPGDDFPVHRAQFTGSFSHVRGTPNWVAYNLEATHFGTEDRCDCFTPDPLLPGGFPQISTADYTGAGAFHGFGIDRGHLVRSADRTAGSLDNAVTYYFTNIVPQAADNNQGPWSDLELHLGNLARAGAHEIYVIAGVAGSRGTLKNEGKIVIPGSVWKVAVIMPRNQGRDDVDDAGDFQLIAVDMPNVAGIRNVDWTTYQTVVDSVEARSGYDLLALLPNHVEWLVESGLTSPQGAGAARLLGILSAGVADLTADGVLSDGNGNSLLAKLAAVAGQLENGNAEGARGPLLAFQNEVRALMRAGHLSADEGQSLLILAGWTAGEI